MFLDSRKCLQSIPVYLLVFENQYIFLVHVYNNYNLFCTHSWHSVFHILYKLWYVLCLLCLVLPLISFWVANIVSLVTNVFKISQCIFLFLRVVTFSLSSTCTITTIYLALVVGILYFIFFTNSDMFCM